MFAVPMIMSTIEDLMRRMNWKEDQTYMVGIITAVVSPAQCAPRSRSASMLSETSQAAVSIAGTIVLVYLYFWRVVAMLKRRWVMWWMGFRRGDHGDVEYFEFESTASDHGGTNSGTNSRRASAGDEDGETCAAATSSPVSPDDRSTVVSERLGGV
jgi:Ca2+/H+ antiporter